MDEEALNLSIRRFLKMVGVKSQREIEQAVQQALSRGALADGQPLEAKMELRLPALGLRVEFDGRIELE